MDIISCDVSYDHDVLVTEKSDVQKKWRICFEFDEEEHLIWPWSCTGSMKYVHEEWLKTWLKPRVDDLENTKWEVWQTPYVFDIFTVKECNLKASMERMTANWMMIPLFVILLAMLILIMTLLIDKVNETTNEAAQGVIVVTLVLSTLGMVGILTVIVYALKKSLIVDVLKKWSVLSQEDAHNDAALATTARGMTTNRIHPAPDLNVENLTMQYNQVEDFYINSCSPRNHDFIISSCSPRNRDYSRASRVSAHRLLSRSSLDIPGQESMNNSVL